MAEPFNAEQFRQQMSGQAPQGQPPATVQGQPQMVQTHSSPQPYQPQHMPQLQVQPNPYQPQSDGGAQYTAQTMAQPYMPPQQWQPQQIQQPQTPTHHMPLPATFAPPPGMATEEVEEASKTSRFKLNRGDKAKAPKVKKGKAGKSDTVHTTKTSPAIIFMFGMATGIVCFLAGNMLMSNFLTDKSAKSFQEIERRNAQAQQPVLPKTAKNVDEARSLAAP